MKHAPPAPGADPDADATADALMCAALAGGEAAWPADWGAEAQDAFLRRSAVQGLTVLLHGSRAATRWPARLRAALQGAAAEQTLWEMRHQQILADVIGRLRATSIEPVLFKGTALAYTHYASAQQRLRGDTDLIVDPRDAARAGQVLDAMGFARPNAVSGQVVSTQSSHVLCGFANEPHVLDLHWQVNNSALLAGLLSYGDLRAQAREVPPLAPGALVACDAHALLLACLHRHAHRHNPIHVGGAAHSDEDRLVWLFDILLLARALDAGAWAMLGDLADRLGALGVCAGGISQACARFGEPVPALARGLLARSRDAAPRALDAYARAGRWRQRWLDFVALGSTGRRTRFARETLMPPEAYMRAKYPGCAWPLPLLYLRRLWGGLVRAALPAGLRR